MRWQGDVGEAKTGSKCFVVDEIAQDMELSVSPEADVHLMFAMDAISEVATDRARSCAKDRDIGLIVIKEQNLRELVLPQVH